MSDTQVCYEQLRSRARVLVVGLDDAMTDLMAVERAFADVMKADLDNPGEMSTTDSADMRQLIETAQFSVRAAERIAVEHSNDVERTMKRLGLWHEKEDE